MLLQGKSVDKTVMGDLDLRNASIRKLPDNLTVEGYVNLSYSAIGSLPDNLTVENVYYLSDTPIIHQ